MKPATEAQKNKLRNLKISFSENISLEDARELLQAELDGDEIKRKDVTDVGYDAIVENSDWED